jgi:hypothetical protein
MGERLENLEIWHGGFRELLRKIRPYLLSQEGIAAEIDAALSASAEPSALIGDGVHDDTEGVRAALERKP